MLWQKTMKQKSFNEFHNLSQALQSLKQLSLKIAISHSHFFCARSIFIINILIFFLLFFVILFYFYLKTNRALAIIQNIYIYVYCTYKRTLCTFVTRQCIRKLRRFCAKMRAHYALYDENTHILLSAISK